MNPILLKTPNARLIYQKCHFDSDLDLNAHLLNLEHLVVSETRFQWAHQHAYLYFFKSAEAADFKKTPFWLAREVIGTPNEDFENRYFLQDLNASEVLSFSLETALAWPKWTECLSMEQKVRAWSQSSGQNLADTWRLEWDLSLGDPLCRLQFFRTTSEALS